MSDQHSQMANTSPSSPLGGKRFFIVLFLFSNVVINDASGVGGGGCGLVGAARLWHVAVLFTVSCGTQSAAPAAPGAEVAAAQEGSNPSLSASSPESQFLRNVTRHTSCALAVRDVARAKVSTGFRKGGWKPRILFCRIRQARTVL